MTSPPQDVANRLNAAKSTGPASPNGKARSSLNAFRHGLTARIVVLPSEDMTAYRAFSKEIVDSLDTQTPVEREFAQTVADNLWRINRIRSIEDGILAEGHSEDAGDVDAEHPDIHSALSTSRAFRAHSKELATLSLYEQRLHRSMREDLRQLEDLKEARRLCKTEETKGSSQVGFVYWTPRTASRSTSPDEPALTPRPYSSPQSAQNPPDPPKETPPSRPPNDTRGSP